jgi:hypothetical protein
LSILNSPQRHRGTEKEIRKEVLCDSVVIAIGNLLPAFFGDELLVVRGREQAV